MNNLATTNNKEITITESGDAFISQTKVAAMCGINQSTIQSAISRQSSYAVWWNLNENNQLDAESAFNAVAYYAGQGKPEALQSLIKIGAAGMKAYIYHEAGYKMDAKPSVPMTYLEALKELVATQELLEAAKPAIAFHGQLYSQNRAISINEYAKLLSDTHECIIGPNKLMDFLRKEKILMKGRDRHEKNMPYQKYLNCKWFEVEYHQTTVGLMATPMILPLGQTMLAEKILDNFKI